MVAQGFQVLNLIHRSLHPVRGERDLPQARSNGIEDRISDGGRRWPLGRLSTA